MTKLLCETLITILLAAPCIAEQGTVTFYTPGDTPKSVAASLLPRSQQPFIGWLFDGPQRLAHLRPGRFMTFRLDSGAHSFNAPYRSKRPGKVKLMMNVESGRHYCVRLYARQTNFEVLPLDLLSSQIEEVPCQQAQREGAHLKPIELKRIDQAVSGQLEPTLTFPSEIGPALP